jgi:hypothetical protein
MTVISSSGRCSLIGIALSTLADKISKLAYKKNRAA